MTTINYRVFYTQKSGNRLKQYEDAYGSQQQGLIPITDIWRGVVVDGASEGGFSQYWGNMLVNLYLTNPPGLTPDLNKLADWFLQATQEWQQQTVPQLIEQYRDTARFYAIQQNLMLKGSAATFVTLELNPHEESWKAVAIGDSCVFHVRDGYLLHHLPLHKLHPSEFDSDPVLISTQLERHEKTWQKIKAEDSYLKARYQSGDFFFLMTDAIAQWFLKQHEQQNQSSGSRAFEDAIRVLSGFRDRKTFLTWLHSLRQTGHIKNDDVTIAIMGIDENRQINYQSLMEPDEAEFAEITPASNIPASEFPDTYSERIEVEPPSRNHELEPSALSWTVRSIKNDSIGIENSPVIKNFLAHWLDFRNRRIFFGGVLLFLLSVFMICCLTTIIPGDKSSDSKKNDDRDTGTTTLENENLPDIQLTATLKNNPDVTTPTVSVTPSFTYTATSDPTDTPTRTPEPIQNSLPETGNSCDPGQVEYVIESGDTLSSIAREYRVTIDQLQQINGIDGIMIYAGNKLCIPQPQQENFR